MLPEIDLVITFRASQNNGDKQQALEEARRAEEQYGRLVQILSSSGLRVAARRGDSLGHLLVFVSCPSNRLQDLIKRERHSDFLSGLPTTPVATAEDQLAPADRIRLVHALVMSMPIDGGLGISPDSPDWDLVESVMTIHDREFNEHWIHTWTTNRWVSVKEDHLREQFGDSVAMYFLFLHGYTLALIFPAALGLLFYFFGSPYSPIYSTLIVLWSIVFVEWWRVRERKISLQFGSRGSFRVEKRRAQYVEGFPWWKHELRMIASLPIIALFAAVLVGILTAIFVVEAFVTTLYSGPGDKYMAFSPTVLFVMLVPRLLDVYQSIMTRLTAWENHAHQSSHIASLTIKTFALSALVAYMGLVLDAFVYVPFGEEIMRMVQTWLSKGAADIDIAAATLNATSLLNATEHTKRILEADTSVALNAGRLRDQMIAYTVTDQIMNAFTEIGLPYITRGVDSFRWRKSSRKRDEKQSDHDLPEGEEEQSSTEERALVEQVRKEAAHPEYDLFEDYSEMVTQFGYVVLWSAIWPLAPVMALVNNFFELRSDAFKITVHVRRPIPVRTDTIGPWLDTLTFLTWLAAVINSALVYLFNYRSATPATPHEAAKDGGAAPRKLLTTALVIAFLASHGYIALRAVVRHCIEKALWHASEEVRMSQQGEREVKRRFLVDVAGTDVGDDEHHVSREDVIPHHPSEEKVDGLASFWDYDEGMQEIQRIEKSA
ncbi:calcium-activated chloride channel-domain-containing protein [Favolaschia claudopus]|uniref:Calcium-activated chloride channel-domain-containing protein n=1 Tax=Favolaschia claudopus TaxID=2862362 RepID=A0AAW0BZS4_9AGAR